MSDTTITLHVSDEGLKWHERDAQIAALKREAVRIIRKIERLSNENRERKDKIGAPIPEIFETGSAAV